MREISGRHKSEEEKAQCPSCTYERKEGQGCPVEGRRCNACGAKGHFGMSRLCTKKKKSTRTVKEEPEQSSSEDSESEEEDKGVNRVDKEHGWPGTSSKAWHRRVRHITGAV